MEKKFKFIFIFLSTLFIINIVVFILNFKDQDISDNISDWASFSNYFSGISGIILSILTLIVTVYIAFVLNRIEENRNKENKEYDNNKFLRELREKEYSNITDNLNNVWESIILTDRNQAQDNLYVINMRFENFIRYKQYLFPNLRIEKFKKLTTALEQLHALSAKKIEINNPQTIETLQIFIQEIELFHEEVQNYILTNNNS